MTTIWGIHNDQPDIDPIADGAVRIGWEDIGDFSLIEATREAFKKEIAERMPQLSKSQIPTYAGTPYRFVHEMKEGDIVVCPNRKLRTFDIGYVSGPYEYHPENSVHKNWRRVKWVRTGVPRRKLSRESRQELGSAITLFKIKTAKEEIERLITSLTHDDNPDFTWTDFYPRLVDALLPYRNDRTALIEKVMTAAQASGNPKVFEYLQKDKYDNGARGLVRDIDPFTILGTFNRGVREETRSAIAAAYGNEFKVDPPYPEQFPGIPILNNMASWFFHWENERPDDEIENMWSLCSAAVAYSDNANEETREALVSAFDAASTLGTIKLSMGLFWARPRSFAAYDAQNRRFLKDQFPDIAAKLTLTSRIDGEQFLDNTEILKAWIDDPASPFKSFAEFSFAAWQHAPSPSEETSTPSPITSIDAVAQSSIADQGEPYNLETLREDGCFISLADLESMLERLKTKKNIILQGPPGTGKTWLSRRLGWALCDEQGSNRVQVMQFHPSLTYEDFVRGWRPTGSGLDLIDGPFLDMCSRAKADIEQPYVLVIEEVNRGNPAQIFGELLTLMESDKRNKDYAMRLAYPRENEQFFIPPNLFIIGTMNVADRSLAIVDMALRRRFAFIEIEPSFGDDWIQHVSGLGYDMDLLETYGERLRGLNKTISDDSSLGRQYCIGHSFFTPDIPLEETGLNSQQWWIRVIKTDIKPLLEEYWFDRPEEAEKAVSRLIGG